MGKDLLQWCGLLDWWFTSPDCPEDCPAEQSRPMEVCTSKGGLEADAYNDADKGGRPESGIKQSKANRINTPYCIRNYGFACSSTQYGITRTAYGSHTECSHQVGAGIRESQHQLKCLQSACHQTRDVSDQFSNWVQYSQSPTDSSRWLPNKSPGRFSGCVGAVYENCSPMNGHVSRHSVENARGQAGKDTRNSRSVRLISINSKFGNGKVLATKHLGSLRENEQKGRRQRRNRLLSSGGRRCCCRASGLAAPFSLTKDFVTVYHGGCLTQRATSIVFIACAPRRISRRILRLRVLDLKTTTSYMCEAMARKARI